VHSGFSIGIHIYTVQRVDCCVVGYAVYANNLECYQQSATSQCNTYWEDLTPWLTNITAYQFYCESSNTIARNLKT